MPLRFYNSMGRRMMLFKPRVEGEVKIYTCGPTVWNYVHVGNFRTFVFEDLLRRYLKFKGYNVVQVMNITDVEDNIIKGMKQFNMSLKELTARYEKAFMEDLSTLRMERAEHYPRATENIPEMVAMIKELLRKRYAYRETDGSIYFDISRFRRYGRLSGIKPAELKVGDRVAKDHYEKEDARDFALWKAWDPADGDVWWDTELGRGRPGWHIECSAMSIKYLGASFDIHTGGIDNRFPHHENEIAQSEAATGRKFVKYWLHSNFLSSSGEEMHKSRGNITTVRELLAKGWNPLTLRFFLISSRYRDQSDLNDEALRQADAGRARVQELVRRLQSIRTSAPSSGDSPLGETFLEEFETAMDDDLNTPRALAALFSFVKEANSLMERGQLRSATAKSLIRALERADSVLAFLDFGREEIPGPLAELMARRNEARRRKDFAEADDLRAQLLEEGIIVEDTPKGTQWRRKTDG